MEGKKIKRFLSKVIIKFYSRKSLTNQKLKALHTELKVHDKEAMALKKLLADGMDKEGLREAELRKKFNGIMHSYGMVKPSIKFEDDKKQLKKVSFTLVLYLKVDIFLRHFQTFTYYNFYVNAVQAKYTI